MKGCNKMGSISLRIAVSSVSPFREPTDIIIALYGIVGKFFFTDFGLKSRQKIKLRKGNEEADQSWEV